MALERFTGVDASELRACITDGGNDRGIDAVFIDHEDRRVQLFQFKCFRSFEKARSNFSGIEVDKILSFLQDLFGKRIRDGQSCNALLYQKCIEIWELLDEGPASFEINLISNGQKLQEPDRVRFESALEEYKCISLKQYGLRELSSAFSTRRPDSSERKIHFVEDQLLVRTDGSARGLQGTVKLSELVAFLQSPVDGDYIDSGLFHENFRLYQGGKNAVNRRIQTSAVTDTNYEFWYLNNGITIVCKDFVYQPKYLAPVTLIGAQIVNGCQTAHAIFESAQLHPDRLKGATISVKVIATSDDAFVDRVAEATNSQTPIRGRDLRANDLAQIKIEQSLLSLGLFYERKRNQHSSEPISKRVDALKAGQVVLAYFNKEPDKAKTQSNEIFGDLFENVFDPRRIDGSGIYAAFSLFTMLEKRRDIAIKNMKAKNGHEYDEAWIVEGIFHLLMVVALLAERDSIDLRNIESVSKLIDEGIDVISTFVAENPGVAAYRLFRSVSTKQKLMERITPRQLRLAI